MAYLAKVFKGKLLKENNESVEDVAVKIDHITDMVEHPMLLHEVCALSILKDNRHIPEVYAWGRSQYYEYLVLQSLGPTLEALFEIKAKDSQKERVSLRNLASLVCQMLDVVEHVHSKGIVHRDIKPDNFVLGAPDTEFAGHLYLIDFGLCKFYRDPKTSRHLPDLSRERRLASRTFATINDHYHRTLSRRDDMISLAYTIMALLTGILPWEFPLEDDQDTCGIPREALWNGGVISEGYPVVFSDFFNYAVKLQYDETPDYDLWKSRFHQLIPDLPENPLYDSNDTSQPRVGDSFTKVDEMTPANLETHLPMSNSTAPIPPCDDGWKPANEMIWDGPHSLESGDVLDDDELKFVIDSHIHIIEETPTSDVPLLDLDCPPERMRQVEELKRSCNLS
ncbi:kinase-like domain-containing protein [Ganoderma leucocontextum]|nr:kinase-like domain-containing protein [Ganoderma leucocontextum]